jgi:protein arginine N-methyltransferase 5
LNDPTKSNGRFIRVEFEADDKYGMGNGSGYGLYNEQEALIANMKNGDDKEVGAGITIHGLSGSFDSLLYKSETEEDEEHISIAPQTFSVGMFSWFPLFFPLRDPVFLPPGCKAGVNIWRLADGKKIWYEWSVDVTRDGVLVSSTPVHNPNGRSYQVGL